jgi:hypothetical protein
LAFGEAATRQRPSSPEKTKKAERRRQSAEQAASSKGRRRKEKEKKNDAPTYPPYFEFFLVRFSCFCSLLLGKRFYFHGVFEIKMPLQRNGQKRDRTIYETTG